MKIVMVKDIYDVDTISPVNEKPWVLLKEKMEEENVPTIFDFSGIQLISPWNNRMFKIFLENENVHLRLYSSKEMISSLSGFCILNNLKDGRVENVETKPIVRRDTSKDELIRITGRIKGKIKEESGKGLLRLSDLYDNLATLVTVNSIGRAFSEWCKENDIEEGTLDLNGINVSDNMYNPLSEVLKGLSEMGIEIKPISEDNQTMGKLGIYTSMRFDLSVEEKIEIMKKKLKKNKPVMLSTYKKSRATDYMGRQGEGRIVTNVPAVFKRLVRAKDGSIFMELEVFGFENFVSKVHYEWDNDGETHPGVTKNCRRFNVNEVGLYGDFLGKVCHIEEPIHESKELNMDMYVEDEDGEGVRKNLTIPEVMKTVFDEFDVEYDKEYMEKCIKKTRHLMG